MISLLLYVLVITDRFVFTLKEEHKSLKDYQAVLVQKRYGLNRLSEVTLSDHTRFRIQESKVGFLSLADSCITHATLLFGRVLRIEVKNDDTFRSIETGFINSSGGWSILVTATIFFILALSLTFTDVFRNMAGSDFGPYVIFLFQVMLFIFYATTP